MDRTWITATRTALEGQGQGLDGLEAEENLPAAGAWHLGRLWSTLMGSIFILGSGRGWSQKGRLSRKVEKSKGRSSSRKVLPKGRGRGSIQSVGPWQGGWLLYMGLARDQ